LSDFSRYLNVIAPRLPPQHHDRYKDEHKDEQQQEQQSHFSDNSTGEDTSDKKRTKEYIPGSGLVAAMSQVPFIFLKDDFSLESPDLWSTELSTACVGCTANDVEAPIDNLTFYLDIVESHLLKEIEARHEAFFEASVEVQHLRGLVFDLHRSISSIKATTHGLRKETGQGVGVSEKLQRERGNLGDTLGMLSIMEGVAAAQSALSAVLPMDDLSSSSAVIDYAGAINVLDMIHGVLGTTNGPAGTTNKNKEVLQLKCFADLSAKLSSAESYIEQAASMELLDRFRFTGAQAAAASALYRFRTHVDKGRESGDRIVDIVSLHHAIEQWGLMLTHYNGSGKKMNGGGGGGMEVEEEDSNNKEEEEEAEERMLKWQQESLLPPITALLRLGRLPAAIDSVRETSKAALHVAIDDIIEACLDKLTSTHMVPSSYCTTSRNDNTSIGGGGGGEGGHVVASPLSSNTSPPVKQQTKGMTDGLQRITGEQFQMTIETVLLVVAAHMDHVKSLVTAIQSAVHSLQSTGTDTGDDDDSRSSLYAAIDTHLGECTKTLALASASRWSKLLSTRSTTSKSTPPASLAILKDILATTDVMAGMLESHHHVGARISVAGLKQAIQQLCKSAMDHMHSQAMGRMSVMLDQEVWVAAPVSGHIQQFVDSLLLVGNDYDTDSTNDGGGEPELTLRIGPRNNNASCYQVVQSMLLLLSILSDYLAFRKAVPSFNAEVTQRAVHLLKAFNLRSCQLVLGAGAMQTAAGLRSITAKHLALCCSTIDALSALVHPYLQQAFTGSMPSSPRQDMLLRDFYRISQDLGTHSAEIVAKLQSIITDRAQARARQLPSLIVQWSNNYNTDDDDNALPKPSEFVSSIGKQVTILVNVVTPILQEEKCRKLVGNVVRFLATTAMDAFTSLEQQLLDQQQQLASGAVSVAVTRVGDDTATTTGSITIEPAQQQKQQQQQQQPQPVATLDNRGFVNWRKQVEADAAELLKCFQSLPLHDEEKEQVVTLLDSLIAEWRQKTAVLQVVLKNEQVNNTKKVVVLEDVLVSRKEEEEKEVNDDVQEEGPESQFVDNGYAENGDGISEQIKEEEEEVVSVVEKEAEESSSPPPSPPSTAEQQQDNDLLNVDLGIAVESSFDHPLALPSSSTIIINNNNNNNNGTCTFTTTRFEDDGNNDTETS